MPKSKAEKTAQNKRINKRRSERNQFLREHKMAEGCMDCGWKKHHSALCMDHKSDKKFDFSRGSYMATCSWDVFLSEIAKCDVRCANCHTMRHWREKHED